MSLKLDLKIFLFFLLFVITSQLEVYIIMMIFAIIHELGHLVMGLILGFKVEELKLTAIGLRLKFILENTNNKRIGKGNILNLKKVLVAIAGPMTNIVIILILMLIEKINLQLNITYLYQIIIYSNLLIALFNMLPIYPMDGGKVVSEILKIAIGYRKSYKITYIISKTTLIILTIMASILILYIKNIAIIFVIMYLWFLEIQEIRKYNKRKNIEKIVEDMEKKEHNMV